MSTERAVAIGFRLTLVACAIVGVWWVTSDPAGPSPLPPAGPDGSPDPVATDRGPQVVFESTPVVRAAPSASVTGDVTDPHVIDAGRRKAGLRPVLENLQGEPVYVEGIDGPAGR